MLPFVIPEDVYAGWDATAKGAAAEAAWNDKFAAYAKAFPVEAAEYKRRMAGDLPANWKSATDAIIAATNEKAEGVATRKASQNVIGALAPLLPEFLGGSADLTGSNLTSCGSFVHVDAKKPGNYISYGVREFGMFAIMNGMASVSYTHLAMVIYFDVAELKITRDLFSSRFPSAIALVYQKP